MSKEKICSKALGKAGKTADEKISKLFKAKYDGVSGKLPKWVPEPLQDEFYATRNHLLSKFSAEQILHYMEARQELIDFRGTGSTTYYPIELTHHLDTLIYIQKIVSLKEKEGMKAYLGKSGEKVVRGIVLAEKQSEIAKNARPDDLNDLLLEILKSNRNAKTRDILRMLENKLGEGIIETIDWENEVVEWYQETRYSKKSNKIMDERKGSVETTKFTSISARLSRLRKKSL